MDDHIQNGCLLPLAQAVITGLLVGVLALAGCLYWDAPKAGVIALAAGTGGAVLMWVSGLTTWRRLTFGEDVFYSPPPALPQAQSVKVELHQPLDGGRQTQLADLPANLDQLKELADGVMRGGAPFAESTWSGPGRPFTRAQFADLRASMMRKGWLEWRRFDSPGQGCKLTSAGKAVMRSFASVSLSPLCGGDD